MTCVRPPVSPVSQGLDKPTLGGKEEHAARPGHQTSGLDILGRSPSSPLLLAR